MKNFYPCRFEQMSNFTCGTTKRGRSVLITVKQSNCTYGKPIGIDNNSIFLVFMKINKTIFPLLILFLFSGCDAKEPPPPTYQDLLPMIITKGKVQSELIDDFVLEKGKKKKYFTVLPTKYYGSELASKNKINFGRAAAYMWTNGTISQKMELPPGKNRFTVSARGKVVGGEFSKMEFFIDGESLGVVEVAAQKRYSFEKELDEGLHEISIALINGGRVGKERRSLHIKWLLVDRVKVDYGKTLKKINRGIHIDDILNYGQYNPYLIRGKVGKASMNSLLLPPPGMASLEVNIPENAILKFTLGMENFGFEEWVSGSTISVTFTEKGGIKHLLYENSIDPSNTKYWLWKNVEIDLSRLANKKGLLRFETSKLNTERSDFLLIANPKIMAPASSHQPNVILISIDTLRKDHLSLYGYAKPTSPFIDKLSSESVVFKNAIAPAPYTLPSHMTMMTSLFPGTHQIVRENLTPRLSKHWLTLAQILKANGYQTAGFTGGGQVHPVFGFDKGMEAYGFKPKEKSEFTFKKGKKWIAGTLGHPFFLFLHTYDVHTPYDPPPPYDKMFAPNYKGNIDNWKTPRKPINNQLDFNRVISLYDGEIRYVDSQIQNLVSHLKEQGIYDNSLIIITSDHGEEFMERGLMAAHGHTLYNELLHVPLVMKFPKGKWSKTFINDPVGLADLLPTVLDYLEISPPKHIQGISLIKAIKNGGVDSSLTKRIIFSERELRELGGTDLKMETSAQTLSEKYYQRVNKPDEFYDISLDPEEQKNIFGTRKERESNLQDQVKKYRRKNKTLHLLSLDQQPPSTVDMDEELEDQLRALGYLH